MKLLQKWKASPSQHKYAINAALLGDTSEYAWSNLGYWNPSDLTYPQACRQLATQLATAVNLNSKDKLLDLGCGKGASLNLWNHDFKIKHIEAVELQSSCADHIEKKCDFIHSIRADSFLNLNHLQFEFKFDVVLCIDAAYHCDLNSFLNSVSSVLNSKARVGFHCLMLSEKFNTLNSYQKFKLKTLLKCADVDLRHLKTQAELNHVLEKHGFSGVQITDQSEFVLKGFSNYIFSKTSQYQSLKLEQVEQAGLFDRIKIEMTAKLCEKLYNDGLIRYVQITAHYAM